MAACPLEFGTREGNGWLEESDTAEETSERPKCSEMGAWFESQGALFWPEEDRGSLHTRASRSLLERELKGGVASPVTEQEAARLKATRGKPAKAAETHATPEPAKEYFREGEHSMDRRAWPGDGDPGGSERPKRSGELADPASRSAVRA